MPTPFETITAEALKLNADERVALIRRLAASIGPSRPLHREWEAEIERRIAELDSGAVKAFSGERVFAEMRHMIESHRRT